MRTNGYLEYQCKKCANKRKQKLDIHHTKRIKDRKKTISKWLLDYKKSCRCTECNTNDYRVIEFHHLESEDKETCIGQAITRGWSINRILSELSKCIPLCANCHRRTHYHNRLSNTSSPSELIV